MSGKVGSSAQSPFNTDAITASGTKRLIINNTRVEYAGEGIDLTGSIGNTDFLITNSTAKNIHSFCFKFANSANNGTVSHSVAEDCGYAGFVMSGPTEANLPILTGNIHLSHNTAIRPGSNGEWAKYSKGGVGFLILQGSFDQSTPKNIKISDSKTFGAKGKTKYGFYSEVRDHRSNLTLQNVDSFDHMLDGADGFSSPPSQDQTFEELIQSLHHEILGCSSSKGYLDFASQRLRSSDWTTARLEPDLNDLKRRGIYSSCE